MNHHAVFAAVAIVSGGALGIGIYLLQEAGVFDPVSGPFGTGETPTPPVRLVPDAD